MSSESIHVCCRCWIFLLYSIRNFFTAVTKFILNARIQIFSSKTFRRVKIVNNSKSKKQHFNICITKMWKFLSHILDLQIYFRSIVIFYIHYSFIIFKIRLFSKIFHHSQKNRLKSTDISVSFKVPSNLIIGMELIFCKRQLLSKLLRLGSIMV